MALQRMSVILVAFAALLAGCLNSPATPPISNSTEPANALAPPVTVLTDCLDGGTSMGDPESRSSADLPSGWTYDSFATPLQVYDWWICDRVAIAGLERANVSFLLEANFGPEMPPDCAEALNYPAGATINLVNRIWVSDDGLAVQLQEIFDEKIGSFNLTWEQTFSSNTPNAIVTWSFDGNERGNLTLHGDPSGLETATRTQEIFAWKINEGIGFWDIQVDDTSHEGSISGATGEIRPPHHNPNPSGSSWSGGASLVTSTLTIDHHYFEDSTCSV